MQELTDDRFPVSEEHLRLERQERRFHREVNGVDYLSWRELRKRVRADRRYRISHFEMPRALTGEEVLALAHQTLVDRSCTYMDSLRQVGPEYEVPVGDLWETHADPETGRTLVNGSDDDYWSVEYLVGADDEEVDEASVDGILDPVGMSVESIAEEVMAQRREETGVTDPQAAAETLWAVRRAVARTLTDEGRKRQDPAPTAGCSPGQGRRGLRPGLRTGAYDEGRRGPRPASGVPEPAGVLRDGSQASDPPGGGGHHQPDVRSAGPGRPGTGSPVD